LWNAKTGALVAVLEGVESSTRILLALRSPDNGIIAARKSRRQRHMGYALCPVDPIESRDGITEPGGKSSRRTRNADIAYARTVYVNGPSPPESAPREARENLIPALVSKRNRSFKDADVETRRFWLGIGPCQTQEPTRCWSAVPSEAQVASHEKCSGHRDKVNRRQPHGLFAATICLVTGNARRHMQQ
jgi:hypothetical protein